MLKVSKKNKIEKFLNLFGKNKIICTSDSSKQNSPFKVNPIEVAITQNEKLGYDMYFYVNNGGTKQNEIGEITCSFVDLDAGRDKNGKYLTDSKVIQKKGNMLAYINKCPLKPTFYVHTRNGYQLYWIYTKPISSLDKNAWNLLQNKICNHFQNVGADCRVLKINQVMRVPHSIWHKKYEGMKSFLTSVSNFTKKYTFGQVANAFKNEKTTKPVANAWSGKPKVPSAVLPETKNQPLFKNTAYTVENVPAPQYNNNVIQESADFLREVNKVLYYSNHKFLAQQALRLAGELETQLTLRVN